MNQIAPIFKDPAKLTNIIQKGYKVVVIGNDLETVFNPEKQHSDSSELGSYARRLFFIFNDPATELNGNNLRRINTDLDEVNVTYPVNPVVFPKWLKMKVEVNYPYECYVYTSGNLVVDGRCPEIRGSTFRDIAASSLNGSWVSYIALHKDNAKVATAELVPTTEYGPSLDGMKLYIQDDSKSEPMDAILDI